MDRFRGRKEMRVAFTGRLSKGSVFLLALVLIGLMSLSNARAFKGAAANEESSMLKLKGQLLEFRLVSEDQSQIRFYVKLRLTFVNTANEPVILLQQQFDVGAELLARNCEDAKVEKYLYSSAHWPSVSKAPEWASWRRKLDTESPSGDLVSLLPPGGSLSAEVETAINIEKAGSFDRTSKPWDEINRTGTVCLQVVVQTWPINLETNRNPDHLEFGETLRKRWSSHGRLQLDRLTSEPIELSFPSGK